MTPILPFRSFTWELQKLIAQVPRPRFDLCYFDGGHTWDNTGFGVLLVDILLRPGGILVLDDMNWSFGPPRPTTARTRSSPPDTPRTRRRRRRCAAPGT